MKKLKIILAFVLVMAMVFAITACAKEAEGAEGEPSTVPSDSASPSDTAEPSQDAEPGGEAYGTYTIGYSSHGAGVWIIDLHRFWTQHYIEGSIGAKFTSTSANFQSDQMVKDIQNQISAGQDGHMYSATWGTITPTVSELFEDGKVAFAVYDQMISKDMIELCNANPYYAGCVGANPYTIGYDLGVMAGEMGYRKAVMIGGAVGDYIHDQKLGAFEEAFTAAGGEILGVSRCTDPSEAAAKADDLIAAYGADIDCAYGINMDFIIAVINSLRNYDIDGVMTFSSEPDAEGLELVLDGTMSADTPVCMNGPFGAVLLINFLDGHPILDESGQAPWLDLSKSWVVTEERAQMYKQYYLDGYAVPIEDYDQLLYRYNPDVTFDKFCDFINNFTYDYVVAANS